MSAAEPSPPAPTDWQAQVDAAHARLVRAGHVHPVVAVSTSAGRFAAGDAGQRFEIGSVTKVFTSLLLARLAELGVVGLQDRVGDLLPDSLPLGSGVAAVTLESLACHRSGLPRLPPGIGWRTMLSRRRADPYAKLTEPRLLDALAQVSVRGTPGEAPIGYSNLGGGLLGYLLGRAEGSGYEAALTRHILEPLGIADSADFTDRDLHQGHGRRGPVPPWHLAELAGAGGLRSPADALLTFLETVRDGEGPLAAAIAETRRPRGDRSPLQIGLGWFLLGEGDLLTHNGGTAGARSEVRIETHSGTCVVILGDGRRGTDKAAASLLDPLPRSRR